MDVFFPWTYRMLAGRFGSLSVRLESQQGQMSSASYGAACYGRHCIRPTSLPPLMMKIPNTEAHSSTTIPNTKAENCQSRGRAGGKAGGQGLLLLYMSEAGLSPCVEQSHHEGGRELSKGRPGGRGQGYPGRACASGTQQKTQVC